ncbi:MAG: N-acetyltransferase [Bacteroidales bacterium]|nr:N-acetyltransferase [Bacteroidales bacterium]
MKNRIIHQQDLHRFSMYVEGHEAFVEYVIRDGYLIVTHTYVPKPIKGRGIAGELVNAAYKYADLEGYGCKATCSYALAWLEKHGYC